MDGCLPALESGCIDPRAVLYTTPRRRFRMSVPDSGLACPRGSVRAAVPLRVIRMEDKTMASKHYLANGLLAACVLATAGIGMMDAQARPTDGNDGVRISNPLPALRGAEQPRGTDFSENFDAYAVGSNVHGQGGWKGWFNDPAAGAFVDDAFSSSPSNSLNISTTSDLIHEFDQAGGVWVVRAMQYIPGDYAGQSYFIMQNSYDDAGANLNWSVQVQFDSATGTVLNDGGVSGGSMAYVTDEWKEIRLEIDLDNNIQSF